MDLIALADFAAGIVIIYYFGQIYTIKKHFQVWNYIFVNACHEWYLVYVIFNKKYFIV